eukprot:g8123.t2
MAGLKLPDNWEEDTRFDGPEHWGMEKRWKHLFPKRGTRVDDSSDSDSSTGSDSDSDSLGESGSESESDGILRAKDTVDISKDDDDDDDDDFAGEDEDDEDFFGASNSEGDSHDATSLRIGVAGTRKKIEMPGTTDEREVAVNSSSKRPSKSTNMSGSGSFSGSSKARREQAKATARRWRHGTRDTEPASSCSARVGAGVGRRGPRTESGTPVHVSRDEYCLSSSEGEEEFDESEANITGHERSPAVATLKTLKATPRQKERKVGGSVGESPQSAGRSSKSIKETRRRMGKGKQGGKGRTASPLACDDSESDSDTDSSGGSVRSPDIEIGGQNDDIESVMSDSSDDEFSNYASSAVGGGSGGFRSGRSDGGGGNRGGKDSSRRSPSSPSPPHSHSTTRRKEKHQHPHPTHLKGSVRREGGRRGRSAASHSHSSRASSASERSKDSKGSKASGSPLATASKGKRPTHPGGKNKKLRKVIPAKGDEHGWISKGSGGGGGGGGSGGGSRGRSNPVSSFQPSQAAARKNLERGLTQSKLNFPVVLDD